MKFILVMQRIIYFCVGSKRSCPSPSATMKIKEEKTSNIEKQDCKVGTHSDEISKIQIVNHTFFICVNIFHESRVKDNYSP